MSLTNVFKNTVAKWNPSGGSHSTKGVFFLRVPMGIARKRDKKGGIPPRNSNEVV